MFWKWTRRAWRQYVIGLFVLVGVLVLFNGDIAQGQNNQVVKEAEAFLNQRYICSTYSADKMSVSEKPLRCIASVDSSRVAYWTSSPLMVFYGASDAVVECKCLLPDGSFRNIYVMVRGSGFGIGTRRITWVSLNRDDKKLLSWY